MYSKKRNQYSILTVFISLASCSTWLFNPTDKNNGLDFTTY